jgi:site-specific DNA-methyltransferase (adenine-specific)
MILREEVIGECRLLMGDCLAIASGLDRVSHVISDPPYEESLHAAKGKNRRHIRTDNSTELRAINFTSVDAIRPGIVKLCESLSSGWSILFCTIEGAGRWADAINPSALKYKRACVWVKPDAAPQFNGQGPAQGCEVFIAAWAGKGFARWNAGGKKGVYKGVYSHCTNNRSRHGIHPTEKPVSLMCEILNDFTNTGDTILDPFMGSGTTGVACVKTGRKFVGIESNPAYFRVACERIRKADAQTDMFFERAALKVQMAFHEV